MELEQKLSLRLSQRLVMTPSLQQAIKLLQLTRLELEGVLAQELAENPLLEDPQLEDDGDGEEGAGVEAGDEPPPATGQLEGQLDGQLDGDGQNPAGTNETEPAEPVVAAEAAEAEPERSNDDAMSDVDLDAYFDDYLEFADTAARTGQTYEVREAVPLENTLSQEEDLYDHLRFQIHMATVPQAVRELAELVVGNLNPDGFLVATMEELQLLGATPEEAAAYRAAHEAWQSAAGAGQAGPEPPPPAVPGTPRADLEAALALVRSLDPPGVGWWTLRQSLAAQLRLLAPEDALARRLVDDCWDLVLKRQFASVAKQLALALRDLEQPLMIIRSLETRPGRRYNRERPVYGEPDVAVIKVGGEYVVQLNDDGLPRLRVSRSYRRMLQDMKRDGRQVEAQQYIREKMRSAVWLIKSLDQRQRTIYKVASSIVKQQHEFLERGIEHLRPMVLRDVAEDIGMHESTVSRVVSNKYIHTPRGLYPMKFFFHSGIDRDQGEDISSLSVKRKIKAMIEAEDARRPLSDSDLMRMLQREGIKIARRTVAKYRDELRVPSSNDRKQWF